ncbi:glycoside hydrolase family 95-like protein [Streptomyces sp. NPDC050164]|uniref:glycoside hydrolase family 95-like protein n=1 Tax=Streptomyces sp. NPDC050164 TaxID=3365605 RepID=UPI003791D6A6
MQSHAGELHLLPALPPALANGRVRGLLARGGFEVDLEWREGALVGGELRSRSGNRVLVRSATRLKVTAHGHPVRVRHPEPGVLEFETRTETRYRLTAIGSPTSQSKPKRPSGSAPHRRGATSSG